MLHTRRRALGLLLAAAPLLRPPVLPRALAAKKDCFESKAFGPWKAQATNSQAGARINEVTVRRALRPARGDPGRRELRRQARGLWRCRDCAAAEEIPEAAGEPADRARRSRQGGRQRAALRQLHRHFRRQGEHRAAARHRAVLPRRQILRDRHQARRQGRMPLQGRLRELARRRSTWASERKEALAASAADEKCEPPEGCFITTACCETLGLADDCFELRMLRRYRDEVLAKRPGGAGEIAAYYALAPLILARLPHEAREQRLRSVYARYILPASLAAQMRTQRAGLSALCADAGRACRRAHADDRKGAGLSPRPLA